MKRERRIPRSLRHRWPRVFALSVSLLVPIALLGSCDSGVLGGRLQGVAVDPPKDVPGFEFTLPDGARFSTAPEADRPLVLFFGYTHCPDVCPTTLSDWKKVQTELGEDARRVRFVFVTVDPERDTPDVAQRYAKQFDSSFVGVSGDSLTTARIQEAFGIGAILDAPTAPNEYLVGHSSQTFLVDSRGRLVALYSFGSGWEALAADLERLL